MALITENRVYEQMIYLDEFFEQVDTPAGMVGINLLEHQKVILAALIRLEDERSMIVSDVPNVSMITKDKTAVVRSSAIVLSEAFGSGKTFEILGLILSRPVPKAFPHHVNAAILGTSSRPAFKCNFVHEVRRKVTGPDALLRPTIIIVSSSVVTQWINAITSHTTLSVLTAIDLPSLAKMYEIYKARKINRFDVIIVKNGTVSNSFRLDGEEDAELPDIRPLAGVIAKMTAANCWARVVIDDFDTSRMPTNTPAINALSTIYVSATKKPGRKTRRPETVTKIADMLSAVELRYSDALLDTILFTNFNVRNTSEFVLKSTSIPKIIARRCVYENPNNQYMEMLGAMGAEDAKEIMEMLNGDAVGMAASTMGINTNSVAEIFQRVLANKYDRYVTNCRAYSAIAAAKAMIAALPSFVPMNPDTGRPYLSHTAKFIDSVASGLRKGRHISAEDIGGYRSVELDMKLDAIFADTAEAKEETGRAIKNVIGNIADNNSCQICLMPFGGVGVFINKCCGLVSCDTCGIFGNKISTGHDYKSKQQTLVGKCAGPSCGRVIYPNKDLIYISEDLDIESLLAEKVFEEQVLAEPVVEPAADEVEAVSPKLQALLSIINGDMPANTADIEHNIANLMIGKEDWGIAPAAERKIVVFANFAESIKHIQEFLVINCVEYIKLEGGPKQLHAAVEQFRTSACKVLLVNSSQHCAGINLQFATDMVFFHKILDPNIESQVGGRLIRIGRKYNAVIWYLCYDNESAMLGTR